MATPPVTHLSTFTRSRETWPMHKHKARKRRAERARVARAAQAARDRATDGTNR